MVALVSQSRHPLFPGSSHRALVNRQPEVGEHCAHLVESIVAAGIVQLLAVPGEAVEVTYLGWQVIPRCWVAVAVFRYH